MILKITGSDFRFYALSTFSSTIGFVLFFASFMFIEQELSYDKHWNEAENIYRLDYSSLRKNEDFTIPFLDTSPVALGPALSSYFDEHIESFTRVLLEKVANKTDHFELVHVDKGFSHIFDFKIVNGNIEQVLENRHLVAISTQKARELYGDESVLGRVIEMKGVYGNYNLEIGAVFEPPATHTTLVPFDLLRLYGDQSVKSNLESMGQWLSSKVYTYIRIRNQGFEHIFSQNKQAFVAQNMSLEQVWLNAFQIEKSRLPNYFSYKLEKLTDARLKSYGSSFEVKEQIILIGLIALFAALIMMFNFTNYFAAFIIKRAPEIATRRILGADNYEICSKYLFCTCAIWLTSIVCSVIILFSLSPYIAETFQFIYGVESLTSALLLTALCILVTVALVSFIITFKVTNTSVTALLSNSKNTMSSTGKKLSFILLSCQIGIATCLTTLAISTWFQAKIGFELNREFELEGLYYVQVDMESIPYDINYWQAKDIFRSRLTELNSRHGLMFSELETELFQYSTNKTVFKQHNGQTGSVFFEQVDFGFFQAMGANILAGRTLDSKIPQDNLRQPDSKVNIVLNNSGLLLLGFDNPDNALGKQFVIEDSRRIVVNVVGVVDDIIYSTKSVSVPQIYVLRSFEYKWNSNTGVFIFRADSPDIVSKVHAITERSFPNTNISIERAIEKYLLLTEDEIKLEKSIYTGTAFSFLITLFGVLTLSSYLFKTLNYDIAIMRVCGGSGLDVVLDSIKNVLPFLFGGLIFGFFTGLYSARSWVQQHTIKLDWFDLLFAGLIGAGTIIILLSLVISYTFYTNTRILPSTQLSGSQ